MLILTKIKLIAIGVLLLSTITLGYLYRYEIKKVALLAQELMQAEQVLSETKDRLEEERLARARVEEILQSREKAYRKLQEESARLRRDLEDLRQTDEETSDWATKPIPDAIRNRLLSTEESDTD
jgi:lipopolysaccharide biosynthesis regulator YciM